MLLGTSCHNALIFSELLLVLVVSVGFIYNLLSYPTPYSIFNDGDNVIILSGILSFGNEFVSGPSQIVLNISGFL